MTCETCSNKNESWFCTFCGRRYCAKHLVEHPHHTEGLSRDHRKKFWRLHSTKIRPQPVTVTPQVVQKPLQYIDEKAEDTSKALVKIPPDAVPPPGSVVDFNDSTVNGEHVEPH